MPVVETVAVRKRGIDELLAALDELLLAPRAIRAGDRPQPATSLTLQRRAREIADGRDRPRDAGAPHHPPASTACCCIPSLGPMILAALLFVMFQAVFAWATSRADALEAGVAARSARPSAMRCPPGLLALADRRRRASPASAR